MEAFLLVGHPLLLSLALDFLEFLAIALLPSLIVFSGLFGSSEKEK
jgi:hypothetical protein